MGLLSLLNTDPMLILPYLGAIFSALTIHEFSHGYIAKINGDDTAERLGRLTLNPIKHIDPIGAIMLFLVGFGWAKPIPVNPNNFRNIKSGSVAVSFAGIGANIIFGCFSLLSLSILINFFDISTANYLIKFLYFLAIINISLFVFNLLPVPPLDGYRIIEAFFPVSFRRFAPMIEQWGFILILAIVFLTNIVSVLINLFIVILALIFRVDLTIF